MIIVSVNMRLKSTHSRYMLMKDWKLYNNNLPNVSGKKKINTQFSYLLNSQHHYESAIFWADKLVDLSDGKMLNVLQYK